MDKKDSPIIKIDGSILKDSEFRKLVESMHLSITPMFGISGLGKSVMNTLNPPKEEGDTVKIDEELIIVVCVDNSGFENFVDVGAEYRAKAELSDDREYMAVEDRFGTFRAFKKERFQVLES